RLIESYQKLLSKALIFPKRVVAGAVSVVIATAALATALGSEFVPSLDEGDIAMHALRIPGTSLSQAIEMQHILEEKIKQLPEVHTTFSKIGTAEIANDPMPPSVADGFVMLKPRTQWRNPGKAKEDVVEELETLAQSVPGNNYEFTQPIEMRFNELIAGVRSDVAVKVYGDNLDTLLELASSMAEVLEKVPGSADVKVEQITGLPFLNIIPDKQKLARYGITTTRLQDSVAIAVRGKPAGVVFEGDRRFPIVVRLPEVLREDIESLKQLPLQVPAPREDLSTSKHAQLQRTSTFSENGRYFIPLSEVARVELTEGPNQISRENGKRRIVVTANVRGRSLGEFVDDARRKIEQSVPIPPGYWSAWGGQFEHLISARERLKLVIPLALGLILTLLYMTFGTLRESLLVFTGVPLALSGGVLALWIRGIPFSISAAIGFIALSGVAVLNGLVMVTFIKRLINDGVDADKAVLQGSVTRLRPVLMTALVASFGFLPMAISTGTGSEVQRPLATVVIGGLLTSTILTLFVLPVLYKIFGGKKSQANE
ncbi:MAG: CusA/CzcA family heavy metal efflux RND transporter, partial [Deltaproteobacteria bacterium]|nr:CusA/CzcA family heavy metal efflux RND transporter [Deltaproteobacteria bacterium]